MTKAFRISAVRGSMSGVFTFFSSVEASSNRSDRKNTGFEGCGGNSGVIGSASRSGKGDSAIREQKENARGNGGLKANIASNANSNAFEKNVGSRFEVLVEDYCEDAELVINNGKVKSTCEIGIKHKGVLREISNMLEKKDISGSYPKENFTSNSYLKGEVNRVRKLV
ncbi:hypothetical protein ACOSP7_016924 [Xanthoceras sorbifolium]